MDINPLLNFSSKEFKIECNFQIEITLITIFALNPFPDEVILVFLNKYDEIEYQELTLYIELLKKMGSRIKISPNHQKISIQGGNFLDGLQIDCSHMLQFIPILTIIGLFCNFDTRLYNISDFLNEQKENMEKFIQSLSKMGARIIKNGNFIHIEGPQQLQGINLPNINNDFMYFALVVASIYARTPSMINNISHLSNFRKNFIEILISIGIEINKL